MFHLVSSLVIQLFGKLRKKCSQLSKTAIAMTLVGFLKAVIWLIKSRLWVKLTVMLAVVTIATWIAPLFPPNHEGDLVSVITLQTACAAYLLSISRKDHSQRLLPVLHRMAKVLIPEDDGINVNELNNFVETTNLYTHSLPQQMTVVVLIMEMMQSPFILFHSTVISTWISWNVFMITLILVISALMLRIEMFERVLTTLLLKLQRFIESSTSNVLLVLTLLIAIYSMDIIIKSFNTNVKFLQQGNGHEENGRSIT
jgi:hypothetical protein